MPPVHPLADSPTDSLLGVAGWAGIGLKSALLFAARLDHDANPSLE